MNDDKSNNKDSGTGDELPASEWPMYGVDPQNTGYHPTATGPTGDDVELNTVFESEGVISNSPAIVDETLYVAADNHLHAVDLPSGDLEWKEEVNASPTAHPAVGKGVYAGTKDGIVAIDRDGEEVLWREDIGISSINPVIAGDAVIGTQNLLLHRFDPENGDETTLHNMRNHQGRGPHTNVPAFNNGSVYFAGENTLYAVDSENGEIEWRFKNPNEEPLGESNPAVADGTVYVGGEDQRLYAIDAENGEEEWSIGIDARVECSPSIANGTVYFGGAGTGAQKFFAVDIKSQEYLWDPIKLPYRVQTKPLIADGIVYIPSYHDLVALNSSNGTVKWHYKEFGKREGESIRAPLAISNDILYVPTAGGNVYEVKEK
ncbi:PQQ-binding-like beta-propeller repeat protein [Natrinema versiforme]|nr:PQQ-binding-like beta-propeller repeat protein [Natrinema versiforme]